MPISKEFEPEDQLYIDLDLIEGAFGVLGGVDPQKLCETDVENFCNGLFVNNVKKDIKLLIRNRGD